MNLTIEQLQHILEAAILVAGRPLPIAAMQKLFDEGHEPTVVEIKNALVLLQEKYQVGGIALKEVASGYQFQAKTEFSHWLSRLWEERAPRYSRAFLETLALIAYRQPITRAEIEEVRGVTASSHIIKSLQEREWIRVLGYREIPGKPPLYGTTKTFLDYFNLKSLDELPTLAELKDLANQEAKLQQVEIEFGNENMISTGQQTALAEANGNQIREKKVVGENEVSPEQPTDFSETDFDHIGGDDLENEEKRISAKQPPALPEANNNSIGEDDSINENKISAEQHAALPKADNNSIIEDETTNGIEISTEQRTTLPKTENNSIIENDVTNGNEIFTEQQANLPKTDDNSIIENDFANENRIFTKQHTAVPETDAHNNTTDNDNIEKTSIN